MKYLIYAIWLACLTSFVSCARAWEPDKLDTADKVLLTSVIIIKAIDWRQTQIVAEHPDKWRESNRQLPMHPTMFDVNRHFARSIAEDVVLTYLLPSMFRKTYLGYIALEELSVVRGNMKVGVRMNF